MAAEPLDLRDEPTHAWLHWCGTLNKGPAPRNPNSRDGFCTGCRAEVVPRHAGEIIAYRLVPDP